MTQTIVSGEEFKFADFTVPSQGETACPGVDPVHGLPPVEVVEIDDPPISEPIAELDGGQRMAHLNRQRQQSAITFDEYLVGIRAILVQIRQREQSPIHVRRHVQMLSQNLERLTEHE